MTESGQRVKTGLVFRSGHFNGCSEQEWKNPPLSQLKTVIDLRTTLEANDYPNHLPPGMQHIHWPTEGSSYDRFTGAKDHHMDWRNIFLTLYTHSAQHGTLTSKTTRKVIHCLLQQPFPLCFHCSFGQDRTGILTALLLKLLDVPEKSILQDYLLSNQAPSHKMRREMRANPGKKIYTRKRLIPRAGANSLYLKAFFAEIDRHYNTFTSYAIEHLKLTQPEIDAFRARLLT